MAHVIKVDLKAELFSYAIDEDKKRYLELLDGKLLLVTNANEAPAEVVQRYKSLADIERGFRVLKSNIEIDPVYHRLPRRIRAHALICFMALVLYRAMRMRLKAAHRSESPCTLLEQLRRIHQQTAVTAEGKTLTGLSEITALQRSLFAAMELTPPTPSDLVKLALQYTHWNPIPMKSYSYVREVSYLSGTHMPKPAAALALPSALNLVQHRTL